MRTRLVLVGLCCLAWGLAGPVRAGEAQPPPPGQAAAVPRLCKVHLTNGEELTGIILFSGPRGIILVHEAFDPMERFVPAAAVARIEAIPGDPEQETPKTVTWLVTRALTGRWAVVTEAQPPPPAAESGEEAGGEEEGAEEGAQEGEDQGPARGPRKVHTILPDERNVLESDGRAVLVVPGGEEGERPEDLFKED